MIKNIFPARRRRGNWIGTAVGIMSYTKQHRDSTRQKILNSASRLFSAKGYAAVSIDEVMAGAGLTRGGFYYHFSSKRQLYREAIERAARMRSNRACAADAAWITALLQELADTASSSREGGLAFLAADLRRAEGEVQSAYTRAFLEMNAAHVRGGADEDASLAISAMLIGTAALVQTTDDEPLKRKLFAACNHGARRLLETAPLRSDFSYFWTTVEG
jgi:TetR/AcrR family transcriptional repressor of nem operon